MGSKLGLDLVQGWGQAMATKSRWATLGQAATGQQGATLQAPPYGMC